MGRKQNPAIEAYFERGQKLGDASNRYQQTCRRCGELFKRGRPENMIEHITRKCTAVAPEEREDFITRYNANRSDLPRKPKAMSTSIPDVSALNTLAEVSARDASQAGQVLNGPELSSEQLGEHGHHAMGFGTKM